MTSNQSHGIDPYFIYADGLTGRDILNARTAMPESGRDKALSEAERNRLVRASKSPTPKKTAIQRDLSTFEPIIEVDGTKPKDDEEPERRAGQFTVIQKRDWSGEIRVRTKTEMPLSKPPAQGGDRISKILSDRGARQIADSCHFMSKQKGGYKTFVTATLTPDVRARIKRRKCRAMTCVETEAVDSKTSFAVEIKEAHTAVGFEDGVFIPIEYYWESGIQAEVTRCMDALNKMYVRGWTNESGEKVPSSAPVLGCKVGKVKQGRSGPYTGIDYMRENLCYCWVVEIPENADGEENPHVHIMMNWRIDKQHWADWRERLEGIWGNGYFHLEKIKSPEYAGAYMAKAAGYLTKGAEDKSQGEVRGNRYGISKPARAPDWCTVGEFELGVMGRLIADIHDHMSFKHGELYGERKHLNRALENTPKKYKAKRKQIGQRLAEVRKEINDLPVRASKYQLVIKSKEYFTKFWGWACGMGWLPDRRPATQWLAVFYKRLYLRRKGRELIARKSWSDHEWMCAVKEYSGMETSEERAKVSWEEYDQMKGCVGLYKNNPVSLLVDKNS